MKNIVLTGGGTAGHVTPNIALLPGLRERGYQISYIGSYNGIEKKLIEKEGISYCEIRALAIPNLLIPLSANASRSDQIRQNYIDAMRSGLHTDAVTMILDLLDEACGRQA